MNIEGHRAHHRKLSNERETNKVTQTPTRPNPDEPNKARLATGAQKPGTNTVSISLTTLLSQQSELVHILTKRIKALRI